MDLILCHSTVDFDTLGAAIGLACLSPDSHICLTGEIYPAVQAFLALHQDQYPLIECQVVIREMIRSIVIVRAQHRSQLGMAAEWIDYAISTQQPITIYDHRPKIYTNIPGQHYIEAVGATTTLVVEALKISNRTISPNQATVMALGIHGGTKAFTMAQTTPRDALALAWLMTQDADQKTIADVVIQPPGHLVTAQDVMSSPAKTINQTTSLADAQQILLRYGHGGLCVVNDKEKLQGIITRRDIDLALHHGFSAASVKGHTTHNVKTASPDTPLSEIQSLMAAYNMGRLPVLDEDELVGIITRTDVLRQMYPIQLSQQAALLPSPAIVYKRLQTSLQAYPTALKTGELWTLTTQIAKAAEQQGWHLYIVGGAVRDLLLAPKDAMVSLQDIDLVVDTSRSSTVTGAGVVLAQQIQTNYPDADLQVHGDFQTATLMWRERGNYGPLIIDIATARTEFYPYPAANPEVESSSIRQDLYRRDFTINAMAVRLTAPQPGLLLDFFGGHLDIQQRQVRVLHANSFIEDPTRIFRAVRFAVRLGFSIDSQTERFIRYAIESGIYEDLQTQQTIKRMPALQTRLQAELRYILQANYWAQCLRLLDQMGALSCLHPDLTIDTKLWKQMHRAGRWRQIFISRVGKELEVEPWLVRLEALLAHVAVGAKIARKLQLPLGTIQRLEHLSQAEAVLLNQFNQPAPPKTSDVYHSLIVYDLPTLLLMSIRYPQQIGPYVWHHITQLIHIRPPLNGRDLKQLGYPPGPLYRQILTALTDATLNGEITSPTAATTYLNQHYPLADQEKD